MVRKSPSTIYTRKKLIELFVSFFINFLGNLISIKDISVDDKLVPESTKLKYEPDNTQKNQHIWNISNLSDERKSNNNKENEAQKIPQPLDSATVTTFFVPTESKNQDLISKPHKKFDTRLLVVRDDIVVLPDPNESEENIRRREAIKQVPNYLFLILFCQHFNGKTLQKLHWNYR
jgi:hypothetical protein